jgi:hypothetical protein
MIGKTQIRKWLAKEINPIINQYGFKLVPFTGIYGIVKKEDSIKSMLISQDSNDFLGIIRPEIRFNIIEDLMFKITGMEIYRQLNPTLSLALEEISNKEKLLQNIITSEEDVKEISEKFKKYFPELFLPKLIEYSDPTNVLELWDSLMTIEDKNNIFPDTNNYIKILILSKFMEELKYDQRIDESLKYYTELKMTGKSYYQNNLSYCEKIIEYLKGKNKFLQ